MSVNDDFGSKVKKLTSAMFLICRVMKTYFTVILGVLSARGYDIRTRHSRKG